MDLPSVFGKKKNNKFSYFHGDTLYEQEGSTVHRKEAVAYRL